MYAQSKILDRTKPEVTENVFFGLFGVGPLVFLTLLLFDCMILQQSVDLNDCECHSVVDRDRWIDRYFIDPPRGEFRYLRSTQHYPVKYNNLFLTDSQPKQLCIAIMFVL